MTELQAFLYCPRCGHDLQIDPSQHSTICSNCGFRYYANPKPCTSMILQNDRDEYLLVERAVEPMKGYLDLPGGFVEIGETFEAGAIREAEEELGVIPTELHYLGSFSDTYEFNGIAYTTLAVCFTGRIPDGAALTAADDVARYTFFKLEDIPMDRLGFPSLRQSFEALKAL